MASISQARSGVDQVLPVPEPSDERSEERSATGAGSPGLVSLRTSRSQCGACTEETSLCPRQVTVQRHEGRLKRMRRSVELSAELIQTEIMQPYGGSRWYAAMITATYAPGFEWNPKHISKLVKNAKDWCARRDIPFRYVWVLELTKVGRPHYHLLVWLPLGVTLPKPDVRGWWPYGFTKIERARRPVGYLVKYASKGIDGGQLPKGARLSGSGGLSRSSRLERAWWLCPQWVREIFQAREKPQRAVGGGWLSRITGAFEPARWRLVDRAPDWSWLTFEPVGVVA